MPETIGIKFSTGKEIELTQEELNEFMGLRHHKLTWSIEDAETGEEIMNIPLSRQPIERLKIHLKDMPCAEYKLKGD